MGKPESTGQEIPSWDTAHLPASQDALALHP
jgi:hypothetical protein